MKLLGEIKEKDIGILDGEEILFKNFEFRKSARGIILNEKGEVSIQYVSKRGYYKLPGGGVEIGETETEAFKREVLEEVGANVSIVNDIGIIIEYRNDYNLLHISYGYIAKIDGEIGEPKYEQGEIDDGYESLWMSFEKAYSYLNSELPNNYTGKFIVTRERLFFDEAMKILNIKIN